MSDHSEPLPNPVKTEISKTATSSTAKSTKRHLLGKLTFRLPADLEWKLEYACLMLRGNPKIASEHYGMLAMALANFFDLLEKRGLITFPPMPQQSA
jgi:hypothetical protein